MDAFEPFHRDIFISSPVTNDRQTVMNASAGCFLRVQHGSQTRYENWKKQQPMSETRPIVRTVRTALTQLLFKAKTFVEIVHLS